MHPIKAKRLLKAADQIRTLYPTLAAELDMLAASGTNPPHKGGKAKVTAGMQEALQRIMAKLPSVVVAGGFAVLHWVDIRKTYDLDFVLLGEEFDKIREFFPGGSMKPLIYTLDIEGEIVDFLDPKNFPWTEDAIKNAATGTILNRSVKILTPEYLILYKFRAGRERDFSDIKALLTIKGVADKARSLIGKYMPEEMEDFDALVMESEYGI